MNVDGVSYLDVGAAFFRHDWPNALNAWWGPLYAWFTGIALGLVKPAPEWEFAVVHLVNLAVFLLALFAFRFFLHNLLKWQQLRILKNANDPASVSSLPNWALTLLGYGTFLWISLQVETVYAVGPDLAVLACVCFAAGLLLRVRLQPTFLNFVILGLVLGLGYWVKAILFPLGVVTLGLALLWNKSSKNWRRGMIIATFSFACASAPLVSLLSVQKHRFTFGDSGKLNYAWFVAPRTFARNWQGEIVGSGVPMHPTRQLLEDPPLFEFDGPVVGTYPPWTDPSYWNDGLQWHFKLKPQLQVLASTLPSEGRLLLRERPEIVVGVVILALLSGRRWLVGLGELWPLIAIQLVGLGLYLPLVVNDRYLGGFVLVIFLCFFAAVQLGGHDQKSAEYVVTTVLLMMALSTADYTVRVTTNHLAVPGVGPTSTADDLAAAKELWRMGLHPGDKVAFIGDGTGAFWARLAKLRIIAEIMDSNHGSQQFWKAPEEMKRTVYETFSRTQAKLIVSSCPSAPSIGWKPIRGSSYCFFYL